MSQPSLRLPGRLVTLREFVSSDIDEALAVVGDPAVTDYLSFDAKSRPQTSDMIDGILSRAVQVPRTEYYLAVEHERSLIGFARLGLTGVRAAKLGYAIRPDLWGHGYATDAVRALASFGFQHL